MISCFVRVCARGQARSHYAANVTLNHVKLTPALTLTVGRRTLVRGRGLGSIIKT